VDDTFCACELIEYLFARMDTHSFPIEQAKGAIHALAGEIRGVNPVHLAIVPGAPRWRYPAEGTYLESASPARVSRYILSAAVWA
jgi:hypothetical protein